MLNNFRLFPVRSWALIRILKNIFYAEIQLRLCDGLFYDFRIPKWVPLSFTPPQFNTSVPHKRATSFQPRKSLSSTPKTPRFNTENSSVPSPLSVSHRKPLRSTPPHFHTENPSVSHIPQNNQPVTK